MNKAVSTISIIITIWCIVACDNITDISKKTKEIALAAKQETTKMVAKAVDTAGEQVDKAVVAVGQQVDNANQKLTNAINEAVLQVVNRIKTWIYNALIPFFPWIFIVSFLLLFVALKAAIPLSNFAIIQVPLSFISYILTFWLFSKAGLTSFAVKGSLYIAVPIILVGLVIQLCKKSILPKINSLSTKFATRLTGQQEA